MSLSYPRRIAERRLGTEPYKLISEERIFGKFYNQFCELLASARRIFANGRR